MGYLVLGFLAFILGAWLSSDAVECRIHNQLAQTGVTFIKGRLFKGGVHEGKVE